MNLNFGEEGWKKEEKKGSKEAGGRLAAFDGDAGRLGRAASLPDLHVVGREKAVGASAHASPPALVDHLDVGDDVVGVEGDLVFAG